MQIRIVVSNLLSGSFDGVSSEQATRAAGKRLLYLLNALCAVNDSLRGGDRFPPLYESGIVYRREDSTEDWLALPDLYARKEGDCEDLACARVSELRAKGLRAYPRVTWRRAVNPKTGQPLWLYHVVVMRQAPQSGEYVPGAKEDREILKPGPHGWWFEDPSRVLGMSGKYWPKRAPARRPLAENRVTVVNFPKDA